jgi:hypothetical protein
MFGDVIVAQRRVPRHRFARRTLEGAHHPPEVARVPVVAVIARLVVVSAE